MLNENFISNFYGTNIYMFIDNKSEPYILATHEFENKKEKCFFKIEDSSIIKGYFSDNERYDDVKEWIKINKNELLNMWKNNKYYELEGIE